MPDLPRVDSCCFGLVPLRTGTIIVGIVCLVMTLGVTGPMAWSLGGVFSIVEVVLLICCIISSVLLIIGVVQDTPKYVKFFVIVWLLDIIYVTIMVTVLILRDHQHQNIVNPILSAVVFVCITGYSICVANSYFSSVTGESAIQTA